VASSFGQGGPTSAGIPSDVPANQGPLTGQPGIPVAPIQPVDPTPVADTPLTAQPPTDTNDLIRGTPPGTPSPESVGAPESTLTADASRLVVPQTQQDTEPENSWHILPADAFPGEGDVVLGVSGGVMVRIPISGIGDLLTSPNTSQLGSALSQLNAAIASAKEDFDKRFAEARIVSDVVNLAADQALGTRDILGSVTGGVPTLDNFNAFFGEIARGNLAGAAQAANAKAIAGIEELKVTYAGLNDAIAGTHQIIAAANDSGTAAAIDQERIARITADDALAVDTQTLSATIGGNFSTVNTVSAAYANINGILAGTYGVTLDVNGYVSGFQAINGGSAGSVFNIRADAFNLVMPNFSATPVLRVMNVNGTPTLAFDGQIIADGTVLTGGIRNNAVTNSAGASGAGDSGPVTINVRKGSRIAVTGYYAGGDARSIFAPQSAIVITVNGEDHPFSIPFATINAFTVLDFSATPIFELTATADATWTARCRYTGGSGSTQPVSVRIQEFAR
jgi:hypothetical protein